MTFLQDLIKYRRSITIILTPIVLLPFLIASQSLASRCAYIVILMGVYWLTEALPLGVTSLIPVVLVPAFGIQPAKELTEIYMKDTNMLFVGGLIVAMAVEHRRLHERIALSILLRIPVDPKWLLLGFMIPTWFLSMWISNTATTAMMLPIVNGVVEAMKKQKQQNEEEIDKMGHDDVEMGEFATVNSSVKIASLSTEEVSVSIGEESLVKLAKACNLCIAYSATCGGIATLTGTGPNLILHGTINQIFGNKAGLSYGSWMLYAMPISIICLIVCWVWLLCFFWGPRQAFKTQSSKEQRTKVKQLFTEEYSKLGVMTFAEKSTVVCLCLLIILWFTRDPGFEGFKGWGNLFKYNNIKYCTDSTPSVLMAIILIIWPSVWPFSKENRKSTIEPVLPWSHVQSHFPLGIVLLIGGGFALAKACEVSGLSRLIGENLMFMENLPVQAIIPLLALAAAMFTEVTSNTAVTSILVPIIIPLANCLLINPLYLLLPMTVACSFAFCLPVATPPNAIVFSNGHISVPEMAKAGIVLNVFAVAIVTVVTLTIGDAVFHLSHTPEWLPPCNFNSTINGTRH